jgi:hypothetical protein
MSDQNNFFGDTNPSKENSGNEGGGLVRATIEGVGYKWVDPKLVEGMENYDPEVIQMGGSEYFLKFVHRSLYANGLGLSPTNNFEWDVRTYNGYWADPNDAKNFPLHEPGPGRVRVPVYLFMIFKIRGKPFKWASFAVVEEVLRGDFNTHEAFWIAEYDRQIKTEILDVLKEQEEDVDQKGLNGEKKIKKHNVASNPFIEKMKKKGLKNFKVIDEKTIKAEIPLNQIAETPYDPAVIKEGGLESFAKFIHKCLKLKGFGTSPETTYEFEAKAMMSWIDLKHLDKFPIFEKGPGMIEEPVYVFKITKIGGEPFQWLCAAEVEDILRGCHIKYESVWLPDHLNYIQVGILDRLDKPDSPPWSGGFSGSVSVFPTH